jgi:hypothetical protein
MGIRLFVGRQSHIGTTGGRIAELGEMWKEVTYRDVDVTLQKGRNK